ncbi:MAG: hypothetical protein HY900_08630 [Deltaproteobacteria bacterium]|nr:hypothetical protein [Deltaproteobacteria bacterium]
MQLRKDARIEKAVGELNLWVQRLNEVYGAWQVGWEPAEQRLQDACGEVATACQRVEAALLALSGESPQVERPVIDLAELEAQLGWSPE